MTWWEISAVANAVIMAAYMAISVAIGRALWRSGQWTRNRLGLATTAIFFTCGVHHGLHTLHLLMPAGWMDVLPGHDRAGTSAHDGMAGMEGMAGMDGASPESSSEYSSGNAMRIAFDDFHTASWDIITATAAVWYWSLRSRFPALVRGAAVFEDLKLRQTAERTLRESEERYRGIVETTSEGVALLDEQGRIGYANAQLASLVGRAGPHLIGTALVEMVSDGDREKIEQGLEHVRLEGTQRIEADLRHAQGRPVSAQVALTPRFGVAGEFEGVLAMVADVTDQKSTEAQLRQAQRLDAVGQLAGGVAHDFNNLLTVIDGYAAMVLADIEGADIDGPARDDLTAIRDASARAAALTRQLLAFSRTHPVQPCAVDLNGLVRGIEGMLRRLIREDVELVVTTEADPATVWADHGQLEQVVVNLAVNGRDAMPHGGRLTIATGRPVLDADQAAWLGLEPGPHLLLSVTDTGRGMPVDVQARVFEPFFTTKDQGKGTGLGLSTVYGIVRQARGHIGVESTLGAGSTFRVYLPAVEAVAVARPAEQETDRLADGTETILLVEDDRAVRELTERILLTAGYRTLAAANGPQALALARSEPEIDLLITDVIMPRMNGRQLADQLTERIPGLPILFTSAHTRGVFLTGRHPGSRVSFIDKPFTAAALARKVRDTLDTLDTIDAQHPAAARSDPDPAALDPTALDPVETAAD